MTRARGSRLKRASARQFSPRAKGQSGARLRRHLRARERHCDPDPRARQGGGHLPGEMIGLVGLCAPRRIVSAAIMTRRTRDGAEDHRPISASRLDVWRDWLALVVWAAVVRIGEFKGLCVYRFFEDGVGGVFEGF